MKVDSIARALVVGLFFVNGAAVERDAGAAPRVLPKQAKWDGRAPFSCSSGTHTFENLNVDVRGIALATDGTCSVVLKNCTLSGGYAAIMSSGSSSVVLQGGQINGKVALTASGSANVDLNDAKVTGSMAAIIASGSANVDARSATLRGAVSTSGSAKVAR